MLEKYLVSWNPAATEFLIHFVDMQYKPFFIIHHGVNLSTFNVESLTFFIFFRNQLMLVKCTEIKQGNWQLF